MPSFLKDPYGETAVTNSSLSKDLQRRADAGEFNTAVTPEEPKPFLKAVADRVGKPKINPLSVLNPLGVGGAALGQETEGGEGLITAVGSEILGRTITPDSPDKSFWRKIGEDALVLGVGIPIFAENLIQHPLKTLKGTPGALKESVVDTFSPDYYKAHPLLGVVNLVGNASIVGGIAKSAIMGTVKSSALKVAVDAAEEASVKTALRSSVGKFARYNATEAALTTAVAKTAETGNIGYVAEVTRTIMQKAGAADDVAANIAQKVADDVAINLKQQATRLKIIDPIEHPLKAAGNLLKKTTDPVSALVFGQPSNTAVATLYGAENVAKNPAEFLDIEKWAGAQATERGIANTVENRQRIMQEWADTNPQWQYLDAQGRIDHFKNYARNDLIRKQIHDLTGMDIVTTKALPRQFADAMVDTVRQNADEIKPSAILDILQEHYGNDIAIHRAEIEAVLKNNDTAEALIQAIETLGKPRTLVSFEKFSPEVQKLADEIIGSGYRIGYAPSGKPVSYASDLGVVPGVPQTAADLTKRTWIGRFIDNFGLSPRGTVEGALEYFYRENWTQDALKNVAEKYGGKVKIGNVTIPFENLYSYLDKNKYDIGQLRVNKLQAFAPHSIFDLTAKDFRNIGLPDALAADLEAVGKRALADIPLSQLGLGDKVVNFLRSRSSGFGSWMSNVYDKYLKTAYVGRYNINPFFAAQQYVETVSMSALLFKDPVKALSITPVGTYGEKLGTWTAAKLGKKLEELPFLGKLVNPQELPISQIKLVQDELLSNVLKDLQTFGMSDARITEQVASGVKGKPALDTIRGRAQLEQSVTSNNLWLRAVGYSHVRSMTIMNRGLAEKFGMTLEEALAYTTDAAGKRVYKNPSIVEMMKDTTLSAVHYQPGFLTSPLVKTMNIVWFPFRFSAKTAQVTAKWLGSLTPMQRTAVLSNWIHFSNWANTEEGIKWRKQPGTRSFVGRFINYTFAYESLGKTAEAVTRGQLFGGNTGLVGGVPFGALVNIANQLGYFPEDPEQFSPTTGKAFRKDIPRDPVSAQALSVAVENLLISIMPSMPFYTLSGGAVHTSVSSNVKEVVRGIISSFSEEGEASRKRTKFERGFKNVPQDYNRFSQ